MPKIFVTGSTGFVGKILTRELKSRNYECVAGSREYYGDIATFTGWEGLLTGADVVVHLAARVHVMEESVADPLFEFRKTNVQATVNLAKTAKKSGVKKFIFLSSVKVNGEETFDKPFSEIDNPNPLDPYGVSKAEAETELMRLHEKGVFDVIIIRPPLVYGPGVKANFERLFWMVQKDLPIPFGRVNNKRSLVSVYNLCDLIIKCMDHPNAGGEIFLVSDGIDYSLKEIISLMGKTLGKHPHLLPVSVELMKLGAAVLGKKSYAMRLFGNLHVDISKSEKLLGWKPVKTFVETFKN